jgi:hypothetical protein
MERPEQYVAGDYDFIRARIADNPIYANDLNYQRTLDVLPDALRRAFLEGDWSVFAGQYFDVFEIGRHTRRADTLGMQPWWPRWISIDWGFRHPSAVYWHCAVPAEVARRVKEWRGSQDAENFPRSLHSGPQTTRASGPFDAQGRRDDRVSPSSTVVLPSVAVDTLMDDHATEFEECKRWANSEAGQSAKMTNPAGFANVRAHAEAHLKVIQAASQSPVVS